MSTQNNYFDYYKEKISSSLLEATKCYILIKYAYNSDEETKMYEEEFKKRYTNLYRTIMNLEDEIDTLLVKKVLNIDFYKEKMNFFKSMNVEKTLEVINPQIDEDYEKKASNSTVKLNFYHSNKLEFGPNTRYHVNTTKYGVIDPLAKSEDESAYIFSALNEYFKSKYIKDSKVKKYTKNM